MGLGAWMKKVFSDKNLIKMVVVLHILNGWEIHKYCSKYVNLLLKWPEDCLLEVFVRRIATCVFQWGSRRRVMWNWMEGYKTHNGWVYVVTHMVNWSRWLIISGGCVLCISVWLGSTRCNVLDPLSVSERQNLHKQSQNWCYAVIVPWSHWNIRTNIIAEQDV